MTALEGSAPKGSERAQGPAGARHVWHHNISTDELADSIMFLVAGDGVMVQDQLGNEYIDATSVLGVTQVGHGRSEIADAVARQITQLEYGSLSRGFSNLPAARLADRLVGIGPGEPDLVWFSCTGSEAVDTAIKMARQYHCNTGEHSRFKIIARHGSYHGATFGAMSATGIPASRTNFEPVVPGFFHIAQPYVYRCEAELGCGPDAVGAQAAAALERQIIAEGPDTVAAFIAEPVAIRQAVKVPPPDYWPRIQDICNRYGVLLIVDEVFNGFGRTGRMFGSDQFDVDPDITVVSKGLTSGYVPLAAAIASKTVADVFRGGREVAFAHGGTFSGHPVACAAGLANLDIIEREDLVANSAVQGRLLGSRLAGLADHPLVGDISGIGLIHSIELVADKRAKIPAEPSVGRSVGEYCREHGVLVRFMEPATIYLYPPLIVDRGHIDTIAEVLGGALAELA